MGEIVVRIQLENANDRGAFDLDLLDESRIRSIEIDAVADTGAMMLALPEDVVGQLGIGQVDTFNVRNADGRREALAVAGPLNIRVSGRSMPTNCIVLPDGTDALVGQMVLEGLDLIADCTNQRLSPRPESPDRPLVRL